MLIPFEDVESVEFARQGGGVVSSRTFDLNVKTKNDQEHQFRWGTRVGNKMGGGGKKVKFLGSVCVGLGDVLPCV